MDEEDVFVKTYEEIHGEFSWAAFMNEWRGSVASAHQEVYVYAAGMNPSE